MIANTPKPPYYAVIFTSIRTDGDNGYSKSAERILELAKKQDGFLGFESVRNDIGITVSYWQNLEAIKKWKENETHAIARVKGKNDWYENFKVRIAKVERDYGFIK